MSHMRVYEGIRAWQQVVLLDFGSHIHVKGGISFFVDYYERK